MTYKPKRPSSGEIRSMRDLDLMIHSWGSPSGRPVLLLHGWVDTGLSFQFMVDEMPADWFVIAPDLRGFGASSWPPDGYWFPDYVADLEALVSAYCTSPIVLVGHSMGGSIASIYAGVRPERVSHLVLLDHSGLRPAEIKDAPSHYRQWLDDIEQPPRFRDFESIESFAGYLRAKDPHITLERALFVANNWLTRAETGRYIPCVDPKHKRAMPLLYRREEAKVIWRETSAKVMFVFGEDSRGHEFHLSSLAQQDRDTCYPDHEEHTIPNAGHMVHHDQPEAVVALLTDFIA